METKLRRSFDCFPNEFWSIWCIYNTRFLSNIRSGMYATPVAKGLSSCYFYGYMKYSIRKTKDGFLICIRWLNLVITCMTRMYWQNINGLREREGEKVNLISAETMKICSDLPLPWIPVFYITYCVLPKAESMYDAHD
jgi:hypothetical protein